jgi:membrane-bound lytic murein transglycosylase A
MQFLRSSVLAILLSGLAACSSIAPQKPATPSSSETALSEKEPTPAGTGLRPSAFAALPGWAADDQSEAWPALLASCAVLDKKAEWRLACAQARALGRPDAQVARQFFETYFEPYQLVNADGTNEGLITGYYEPLLHGARKRGGRYQTPLHRTPDDMLTIDIANAYPESKGQQLRGRLAGSNKVFAYLPRAELLQSKALVGKEILWVDDPIGAFFLQVQGSGRVQLADTGETVRVAYANQNGWPYKSIGRYLIDKGELRADRASMQGIKAWAAANPSRLQELLNVNPRYVFFKEEKLSDPSVGPKGALGAPLTPERSIAVDPRFIPLGTPVFLATTLPNSAAPMRRLVIAQDTGSAIKGAVRADYFWGFGDQAGNQAGRMKQRGAMWVLLPKS